jgi:hypothetical protein
MEGLPNHIKWLLEAARWAPSADNTQPWRFSWDDYVLELRFGFEDADNQGGPGDWGLLLSLGAAVENICQAAQAAGITLGQEWPDPPTGIYWRGWFNGKSKPVPRIHDHPLFGRHTNRWPYKKDQITKEIREKAEKMVQGGARIRVLAEEMTIRRMAAMVQKASVLRFQTRELHEWFTDSLRFSNTEVNRGDGLDPATLALPPGGRALLRLMSDWDRMKWLNRFGAHHLFAHMEALPLAHAPVLFAITGPADSKELLQAGRLMERLWVWLNAEGIAVQPYFVLPDQIQRLATGRTPKSFIGRVKRLEADLAAEPVLQGEPLLMLLRAGFPRKTPVRSVRRPLAALVEHRSAPESGPK